MTKFKIEKIEMLNTEAKPIIADCFIFFNELDTLELRLNILNDVVDKFIIAESMFDFSGNQKPFNFDANQNRFAKFLDKIEYIKVFFPIGMENKSQKENFMRDSLITRCNFLNINDWIILSDVDEIPDPEAITFVTTQKRDVYFFETTEHIYWLDCMSDRKYAKSSMAPFGMFFRLSEQRRTQGGFMIRDAGWHFCWQLPIGNILHKINTCSDNLGGTETFLLSCIDKMVTCFDKDISLHFVDVDKTFPKYIIDNKYEYRNLFHKDYSTEEKITTNGNFEVLRR